MNPTLENHVEGTPSRTVVLKNGQMMGFLLSFPLLCLTNYLVFRWAVGWKPPVRVNGDDIVFRARPEVASHWMKKVEAAGLKLSVGKTMVDRTFFTLNSALFRASSTVKMVPFIRSKALFGREDSLYSIPGRYSSFAPGFTGRRRFFLRSCFLRQNVGYLTKAGRSLNRGLGVRVDPPLLKETRLWRRECSYLSLPEEKPPPMAISEWSKRPKGYEIKYSEGKRHVYSKEEKDDLISAVVDAAWESPNGTYQEYFEGGLRVPKIDTRKCARLLGLCKQNVERMLSRSDESVFENYVSRRVRLFPYWAKNNRSSVADDTEVENVEGLKMNLGRGSVFDCRGKLDLKPIQLAPGCRVKLFRRGKGIGPPTCF